MPFFIDYFVWHYSRALKEAFHIWRNLLWFITRLFSIKKLLLSLFAPFRRMSEERKNKWDVEELMGVIIVNLISRILGAFLRLVIICIGLGLLLCLIVGIVAFYAFWLVAPALVVVSTGYSIFLLL